MALDYFDPKSRMNDMVQDLKWNLDRLEQFRTDEHTTLSSYNLTEEEIAAIEQRDFRRVYELGLHPYLLSQLARLIYGTGEKAGSSEAATALIRSLLGDDFDEYMANRQ